uniref:Uncharacterized protein n=1 Tax=Magallana gigas TaxID=29159 RepID=A0A8W8NVV4_MAGGI|nr:uncharacterized protein LOC117687578 isoform X1 [Crassostrea gigas]
MRTLQLCLSIYVVILFCFRCDALNTTTVRSGKSTIGPVFVTVTEKPNQSDQRQVLIRFSGPPDTVLIVNEQKLNKVPDSDGEFVSKVDFENPVDFYLHVRLSSKATSEWLWINIIQDIGYYEIHPSCNLDVTSFDVGEITTYTIVVSECPGKPSGSLIDELYKNGELIYSKEYLIKEETQEYMQKSVTTVSFNRSRMMNDNVELSLWFGLYHVSQDNLTPDFYRAYIIADQGNFLGANLER